MFATALQSMLKKQGAEDFGTPIIDAAKFHGLVVVERCFTVNQ